MKQYTLGGGYQVDVTYREQDVEEYIPLPSVYEEEDNPRFLSIFFSFSRELRSIWAPAYSNSATGE